MSWADDGDDDLGAPPPLSKTPETSPQERKSYATVIVSPPQRIIEPVHVIESRKSQNAPPQFPREAWGIVKTQMKVSVSEGTIPREKPRTVKVSASYQKVEFAVVRERQPRRPEKVPPVEIKCESCKEQRGYLKFTERHVEAQSKSSEHKLQVGTYCLACVTRCAPRCSKPDCQNRVTICLPDARWPFSLFCSSCMTAHRAAEKATQ